MATSTKAKGQPAEPAKAQESSDQRPRLQPLRGRHATFSHAGDDRIGRRGLYPGLPVQDVRGRSLCDSHGVDGSHALGPKQRRRLPEVRHALHNRGQRRGRERNRLCDPRKGGSRRPSVRIARYRTGEDQVYNVPVFKGDRILVTKFSFEVKDPERFDVVVFKYPEEPKINYIKRCVGLPNETIEIRQGNVYRVAESGTEILRKTDPNKQARSAPIGRLRQRPSASSPCSTPGGRSAGRPSKRPRLPTRLPAGRPIRRGWSADNRGPFHLSDKRSRLRDQRLRWIRYRNFVPKTSDWKQLASGQKPINSASRTDHGFLRLQRLFEPAHSARGSRATSIGSRDLNLTVTAPRLRMRQSSINGRRSHVLSS